jgi:hypothetical protein
MEDKMKVDAPKKCEGPSEAELKTWAGGLSLLRAPGDMNSYEWIETLRVINCLEKEDFRECFGQSGPYMWDKFVNEKKADVFEFLCYLDLQNGKTLYDYCLQRLRRKK